MSHRTVTDPPPIACSLTAAGYRQRVDAAGAIARDALIDRAPIEAGARLTFATQDDVRRRLEGFIAAESRCCPFLTMDLRQADDRLVLDVTGPADAAAIIEELFA